MADSNQRLDEHACDLLVFFATSTEKNKLRAVIKGMGGRFDRKKHPTLGKYYGLGQIGSFRVSAVQTDMGAFGHQGSASRAIFFREATSATAVIQLGMAFGVNPAVQRLGDVLVSSSIIPYDRRTVRDIRHRWIPVIRNYEFTYPENLRYPAKESLLAIFSREARRNSQQHAFNIYVGSLLSGGSRIFSRRFRNELVKSIPWSEEPIVGGEMEAAGLLSIGPRDEPLWAVVKGICDFADEDRDQDIARQSRERACENAARFVLSSLLNAGSTD